MVVTDKQYGNMQILVGEATHNEQHISSNQVLDL